MSDKVTPPSNPRGPYTALLMAGSRGPTDPVASYCGISHKAMAPIAGEPMVQHVLRTLAGPDEGLAGAAVLLGVGALFWARRYFIHQEAALVRLESQLRLHNALTVARLGRGSWPEVPEVAMDGLRWRWERVGAPFMICFLCLLAALYLPVTPEAQAVVADAEPQAWQKMDEWLENLKEEKIITPEAEAEELAKVDSLRNQPREKWFSHESLNASDTLKEQLQREIANMGRNLSNAERSLNALQNYGDKLTEEGKEQMLKEFAEALEGLKSDTLPLDPSLLKELSQIDPKNLKSMSQEQLNQLREALKNKGGTCDKMGEGNGQGFGQGKGFLGDGLGEDDAGLGSGPKDGMSTGPGQDGEGPGNGGISRGPGTAPLTLSDEVNDFGAGKNEGVKNEDFSKAQLGTVLGIQDGKHEVDKTSTGPTAAGAAANQGQGGEQVWRESLTPEEKAVLKRVFK